MSGAAVRALLAATSAVVVGVSVAGRAHAQTTVNPVQTTTYALSPGVNPIIFGTATNVNTSATTGSAVYGGSSTQWTVTNNGSLSGNTYGVQVASQSTISNTGTISGVGAIDLANGGGVNNLSGSLLQGVHFGVYATGANSLVVTNAGAISGLSSSATSLGVNLAAGGSVINQAAGVISAGGSGVVIAGASEAVTNAGTISGASESGVELTGGGTVTNQSSGAITGGGSNAVSITGGVGLLSNAGAISTTGAHSQYAVYLGQGGTVNNQAGGSIANANGSAIWITGGNGVVTNAGSVTAALDGIVVTAGFTGNITNETGGTINAEVGISLAGGGTVTNQTGASIASRYTAVQIVGAGTVTNAGALTGASTTSQGAVILSSGGSVVNQAGGTITGGANGVFLGGVGSVTNAGTIGGGTSSIVFQGAGANTLTLETGSTLNGVAIGSTAGGATNALILQGYGVANNNFRSFNTLLAQGSGVWTLGGVSSIGSTEVASGTLQLTGALTSTFQIDSGATLEGATATLLTSSTVVDNGSLVFNEVGNGSFAQSIAGTGGLTMQNVGEVTLTGISSVATTTVVGGTLNVTGQLSSAFTINSGGTLQGSVASLDTTGPIIDNGNLVFNQATNATFGGTVTGAGDLTLLGGGNLRVTGDFSVGSTTVTNGQMTVTGALTSAFTIGGNGTLVGNTATLLATSPVVDNGVLIFNQITNGTFASGINGTGELILQGGGDLTLSGTSSVATTTVADGALIVTGPLTSTFTIANGATLQGSSASLLAQGTTTDNGTLVFDQASDGTFAGAISGAGAITKQNSGALTLSGVSSVASTEVAGGTLIVTGSLTSALTIDSGATLQGSSASLLAVTPVTNNGALVFDQATDGTFANNINGGGTLTKENAGALTLTGTVFASTTTVAAGSLIVAFPASITSNFVIDSGATLEGAAGSLFGSISDSGALVFNEPGTGTYAGTISGAGALLMQNSGVLTLSGLSSVGTTEVAGGTLIVGGSLSSAFTIDSGGTLQGSTSTLLTSSPVVDNGTLILAQATDASFAENITGGGTLLKRLAGALTLTGTSSVASTIVGGGSLIVTGSLTSNFFINNGATLQGSSTTLLAQGTTTDNGTLVFDQASDGTFASGIGGTGEIFKQNSGALTLSGVSSVASTEVAGGTLIVTGSLTSALTIDSGATLQGSSASLLAVTPVTNNGALVFDQATDGTFANNINGGGALTKENAGALTLTGTVFASTTTVAAGSLIVAFPASVTSSFTIDKGAVLQGAAATLAGAVTNNGTLIFDQPGTGTFADTISGTGALIKQNTGALTLSGVDTAATTEVAGGALIVTGALNSALTIDSGATLQGSTSTLTTTAPVVDNGALILTEAASATFANAIDGSGSLTTTSPGVLTLTGTSSIGSTFVAGGTLLVTGFLTTNSFKVEAGATLQASTASLEAAGPNIDNGALVFDQAANGAFLGDITGAGVLIKQNSGLLVLDGVSSLGGATVAEGDLQIGDATHSQAQLTSSVLVDAGAVLSGHGTIVGDVINRGTVSPGGSIGVLTVTGNYTQSAAGLLSIEVAPSGGTPALASLLDVSGIATLDGDLSLVTAPGIYRKGQQVTVLTAGTLSGAFASATATNGLGLALSASGGAEIATFLGGNFSAVGASLNQKAIGLGFVNYPVGVSDFDPVANALIALPAGAQQNAALDKLGGEVDADFLNAGRDNTRQVLGMLSDQLSDGSRLDIVGGPGEGPAVWGKAYGQWGGTDGYAPAGAHGYSSDVAGTVFGAQYAFDDLSSIGAAISYGHTDLSLHGLTQSGALDSGLIALYGERRWGAVFVDGAGSLGFNLGSSIRNIDFTGVSRRATGSFDGYSSGLWAGAGVRLRTSFGLTLEPSVRFVLTENQQQGFTENGATGADLQVRSQSQGGDQSVIGVRALKSFAFGDGVLSLEGRLAEGFELGATHSTIGESFAAAQGTNFVLTGADTGGDTTLISDGVVYDASKRVSFFAHYDGAFSSRHSASGFTLGGQFTW